MHARAGGLERIACIIADTHVVIQFENAGRAIVHAGRRAHFGAGGIAQHRRNQIHCLRLGAPPLGAAPAHPVLAGDAPLARVTVIRDGQRREIEFTAADPSLLDAAARAGIDVPFSCKSGVCSTCRARLLEGEVRMDRNFALEPHEVDAGFILTCQAHPLTERVVVSYDDR